MNLRTVLVLLLAAVCGISAALGISRLQIPSSPGGVTQETVKIVVAKVDMSRGHMISPEMLTTAEWPKSVVLEGTITEMDNALDRATLLQFKAGEPILETKLASKGSGRGLAALVPKGMRACTIQASRTASNIAGFLLPGNHVDILLTVRGNFNDGTGGGTTTTLLQMIQVLAVDQRLDAPAENKVDPKNLRSVTLLVTPDQAALLDLGQTLGQLALSLRNPEDKEEARTRPATLADIRYLQQKPVHKQVGNAGDGTIAPAVLELPIEDAEPQQYKIRTLRGSHAGQVWIDASS